MRFALFAFLFALLAACTMAVAPLKSVIVSFPNDTPDHIVDEAKEAIRKAGGQITHEYNIIKGFAAHAVATSLETVSTLNTQFAATIEEDGVVTTQNDKE
ncbi:hypothetical protein BS50DRAFT_492475 [Corynespora cassiicola Philippines]|uniref:Inhibitor I9 domain-containing protein n=1 Tax=Corynespora cassiicola Philippines TaxID=1448308 RepID=A0A2T2NSN8_CORCC|nr:hypothetical protein BS50DRAFT_492475 [Corynespora cassiicola Philippines]